MGRRFFLSSFAGRALEEGRISDGKNSMTSMKAPPDSASEAASNDNAPPRWTYLIWSNRLLYRRREHTHAGRPEIFEYRLGLWIPSAKLGRTLHGHSGIEDEAMLVNSRVAQLGLALMGSPPKQPFPDTIMDNIPPLDQQNHWLYLKLMAGGAGLTESERSAVDHSLHWFLRGDRPGKVTDAPMTLVADQNDVNAVAQEGDGGADDENTTYLDANCTYRNNDNTSWHQPPPPRSWVIGSTFYGDGMLGSSNWTCSLERMQEVIDVRQDGRRQPGGCYVLRTRSWLTRWIDVLILERDAPPKAIERAAAIKRRIKTHDVLDDEHYSARREAAAQYLWKSWSVEQRRKACEHAELPSYLARRDRISNPVLLAAVEDLTDD